MELALGQIQTFSVSQNVLKSDLKKSHLWANLTHFGPKSGIQSIWSRNGSPVVVENFFVSLDVICRPHGQLSDALVILVLRARVAQ